MSKKNKRNKILSNLVLIVICMIIILGFLSFYNQNNFNNFKKIETIEDVAEFKRDLSVKYTTNNSYRIENKDYDDSMISRTVKVNKNTPYKISCMVKTEDVVAEKENKGIGAQISVIDTTERSTAVQGTNDWQKIELILNSKDRTEIEVCFRLGGYLGNAKGKVWFTDFKIEEGITDNNTDWNFGCFIFTNTDVNIDGNNINISMTSTDISDMENTINRFEACCSTLSNLKMTAKCETYVIDEPIDSLSYDDEFGYYVAPEDIETKIQKYVDENDFDHIFIIIRLGNDEYQDDIETKDWIGLGYMDYYGIGYSNIRLPNDSKNYTYKYNTRINQFPEEVLLHEFLHSLERTAKEYGYDIPELHSYEEYGYKNEVLFGQKTWYKDYMNKNIEYLSTYIGLPSEIYSLKPAKKANFKYSVELDSLEEPKNIIEELKITFSNLFKLISE